MALLRTDFNRLKGVPQGCPLSPYLLILSAKLLSNKNLPGNEIKLSQFADDTTLFNADLVSLEKAQKIVNDFGKLVGLSWNVKKTKAI